MRRKKACIFDDTHTHIYYTDGHKRSSTIAGLEQWNGTVEWNDLSKILLKMYQNFNTKPKTLKPLPNSAQYGPNSAQYSPNSAQYGPNSAQYSPNSAQYSPNSAQYGPNGAHYYSGEYYTPLGEYLGAV